MKSYTTAYHENDAKPTCAANSSLRLKEDPQPGDVTLACIDKKSKRDINKTSYDVVGRKNMAEVSSQSFHLQNR